MLTKIGEAEQKTNEQGLFYNLKISAPFLAEKEFMMVPNREKRGAGSPDYLVLGKYEDIGSGKRKVTDSKKEYVNINIYSPLFFNDTLWLQMWPSKKQDGAFDLLISRGKRNGNGNSKESG